MNNEKILNSATPVVRYSREGAKTYLAVTMVNLITKQNKPQVKTRFAPALIFLNKIIRNNFQKVSKPYLQGDTGMPLACPMARY